MLHGKLLGDNLAHKLVGEGSLMAWAYRSVDGWIRFRTRFRLPRVVLAFHGPRVRRRDVQGSRSVTNRPLILGLDKDITH